ncbi:alpha/beta-hydrolase [Marasmius fiardii PR-910]|nr:alpha/beta-hydrolase [Marasmius fiardii PR-910]
MVSQLFGLGLAFCHVLATYATFVPIVPHLHSLASFQQLDGTPAGKIVKIGGVDTYVSLPRGKAKPKNEAVLYLSDIFGLALVNNKLLADGFADAGYTVFAPDYLNGDPVPADDPNFNITEWSTRHGPDQTLPPTRAVIAALKHQGITKIGATGYCFGGRYSTILSQTNEIKVAAMAHPSSLTIPDDFEIIVANSTVPVEIHSADLDTGFTPALGQVTDGVMAGYKPGYKRFAYAGVGHGFAVRPANASDPVQVKAMQLALARTIDWFNLHL